MYNYSCLLLIVLIFSGMTANAQNGMVGCICTTGGLMILTESRSGGL